jgi:O-antigen/teichoic acid export membrane protein
MSAAFIAMGRNSYLNYLGVVGVLTSVIANIVLIPLLSYDGAAVAHLLTSCALLLTSVILTLGLSSIRRLDVQPLIRIGACWAGALVIGFICVRLVLWPVAVVLSLTTYFVLLEALRAAGPRGLRGLISRQR